MDTTFKTNKEILNAIDNQLIIAGIVEVDWSVTNEMSLEETNDYLTNLLVGEDNGYWLEDIGYSLAGCNTVKQTILIEVKANAKQLMFNKESGFAQWCKRNQK